MVYDMPLPAHKSSLLSVTSPATPLIAKTTALSSNNQFVSTNTPAVVMKP